jgi:hypothetical protein
MTASSIRPATFGAWRDADAPTLTVDVLAVFVAGLLGRVLFYDPWFCHLPLFNGTSHSSGIGLLVVVQTIVSSSLISHLFDIHEGWMYVLGVRVAGAALKMRVDRGQSHVGKICYMQNKGKLTPAGNSQARSAVSGSLK